MNVDQETGEIHDEPAGMELVPLNLAALDEDKLAQMFPSPAQAMAALIQARETLARAPGALNKYRGILRKAQRDLKIALGLAVKDLRLEFPRATLSELRDLAYGEDSRVITALDAADDAWLMYEYAKDFKAAIKDDIDVLRSINKNLRGEAS